MAGLLHFNGIVGLLAVQAIFAFGHNLSGKIHYVNFLEEIYHKDK